MMGTDTCYSCGKPSHMVKYCSNRRSQEKEKERVQPNCPSEKAPRTKRFFSLKSRGAKEAPLVKSRLSSLN